MAHLNDQHTSRYFRLIDQIISDACTEQQNFTNREHVLHHMTVLRDAARSILASLTFNDPCATYLDLSQLAWMASFDPEAAADMFMFCEGQVSGIDFYFKEAAKEAELPQ